MNVINSDKVGKCQYCQQKKTLIKAHIIPQALHAPSSGYISLVDKTGKIGKVRNNGWLDKNILCKECDGKIGVWEEKLIEFLKNPDCYKYQFVKLAVLSIMWKAHITTHKEFKYLDLGSFGNKIYELIKNEKTIQEEDFPIWVNRYEAQDQNANDVLQKMVLPGLHFILGGINFWRFDFLGYQIVGKVDSKQLPSHYKNFIKAASPNIDILHYIATSTSSFPPTSSMHDVFLPYIR